MKKLLKQLDIALSTLAGSKVTTLFVTRLQRTDVFLCSFLPCREEGGNPRGGWMYVEMCRCKRKTVAVFWDGECFERSWFVLSNGYPGLKTRQVIWQAGLGHAYSKSEKMDEEHDGTQCTNPRQDSRVAVLLFSWTFPFQSKDPLILIINFNCSKCMLLEDDLHERGFKNIKYTFHHSTIRKRTESTQEKGNRLSVD